MDTARVNLVDHIRQSLDQSQVVVVTGERGLGQRATIHEALARLGHWEHLATNGKWLTKGYLAGFQEVFERAFHWCDQHDPELISRHEQSIKRIYPRYNSPHFRVPKDLTNTSSKEERTRFYHHEYQNKLLVGLSKFLLDYVRATETPILLSIDNASLMSPTSRNLLSILLRTPSSEALIKFLLIDYERQLLIPQATTVEFPKYSFPEMIQLLDLAASYPAEKAYQIYQSSRGNLMIARALLDCLEFGLPVVGYIDSRAVVDLYLAAVDDRHRMTLFSQFVATDCEAERYIEIRNYETFDSERADAEHQERHDRCMAEFEAGAAPLVVLHAWSIRNKYKRLDALVQPSEILQSVGLYDTWFTYFGEIFADPDLRYHGTGNDPSNAAFINAAFVLYSLGAGKVSSPYLDEFSRTFAGSDFTPTVLYAQSMTYGRYQQPVDLPLAERYALLNLATIEANFKNYEKYHYIKVFAENAYAYIKARQGKYDEALALCVDGNRRMVEVYGDRKFRLHQSILIYNTSQVYEIVGDYDRAEAQLRLAMAYDPYYGEYQNDLGNLLSGLEGREEEALSAYATAIELCPPYYEAFLNRGMLHGRLGHYAAAVMDFEQTLMIKPQEWRAFLEIGNINLAQGHYAEALRYYRQAISIDPLNADLQCNLGLAYSECGEIEASVMHYRAAIALRPRHAVSHHNLAVELFNRGEHKKALHHATIATEIGGSQAYDANRALFARKMATGNQLG